VQTFGRRGGLGFRLGKALKMDISSALKIMSTNERKRLKINWEGTECLEKINVVWKN
jgi:hypothetical protein